jgi:hypothetical protein
MKLCEGMSVLMELQVRLNHREESTKIASRKGFYINIA